MEESRSHQTNQRSPREVLAAAGAPARASEPQVAAREEARRSVLERRCNLIFFFPDEMRADALACYGNPVTLTPNFDRLAKEGTRFANCHVQHPYCGPSRCSLLTGWPMSAHGHRSQFFLLRPDEPNMFRYLKDAGYDVFWYGKNDALAQQSFAASATEWHFHPPYLGEMPPALKAAFEKTSPCTMLFPGGLDRRNTGDYADVQRAIRILERKEADRPFCIFLPLFYPHPPYMPPAGFDKMYESGDLPPLVPPNLPGKPSFHAAVRETHGLTSLADPVLREIRAAYYGNVSFSDWLLGELLEAVDRTGHAADTAIIASSDHGDYAGDYGLVEKWASGLESCLTHVPLISRVPGGVSGAVRPEMYELFDIMPTLLELGGTRASHTHFARSLVPQICGEFGNVNRAAFSEGGYNIYEPQAFHPPFASGMYAPKTNLENDQPQTVSRCASVKTARYTYIVRPQGQSELYDRAEDPHETNNLLDSKTHQAVREELQMRLVNWYINTSGVPPMDRDPRATPPFDPIPHPKSHLGARNEILDL